MQDQNPGAHDGFSGSPGTFLLQDGERIPVDPLTLNPLTEPEPTQVPGKTKPASESAKKPVSKANITE